nr:hypothetical protein [Tanacetum cinerariifolium]
MASEGFRAYWVRGSRKIATKADLRDYWTWISSVSDFLIEVSSYTAIRDPLRRLCHRLIAFSISGRGQTPEKAPHPPPSAATRTMTQRMARLKEETHRLDVTVFNPEPVTSLVRTKVKTNDQESKINKLTKMIQMLMDEKINSTQKSQELISVSLKPESSNSVNSPKQSQDSKLNDKNLNSSKPVRPKPLQKPKLKCEICNYTNHLTDDCYSILYCMKCKREDHRTSNHDMYIASLRSSQNYKAQPYQYTSPSKQILKSKAKPYPSCTRCGFNDHLSDDCENYPECKIYGSYDHFTSKHN